MILTNLSITCTNPQEKQSTKTWHLTQFHSTQGILLKLLSAQSTQQFHIHRHSILSQYYMEEYISYLTMPNIVRPLYRLLPEPNCLPEGSCLINFQFWTLPLIQLLNPFQHVSTTCLASACHLINSNSD